jgi:hypothetical protein
MLKRLNDGIEAYFVQPIAQSSATLMRATVWLVFLSGYALSALVFVRWAHVSFRTMLTGTFATPKEIIHALLLSIELLILVPVPAIVGIVSYRTLMHLSDTQNDLQASKNQVQMAEQLLIGLLVTVTGTTMLDVLIIGDGDLLHYAGGAAIIMSLSLFLYITRR